MICTLPKRGQGALVAGNTVCAVEVEEQVADAQRAKLADPEAADGGQAGGEAVPVVGQGGGPPGQKALDHSPVNGEEEGTLRALQGAQQPRELVGAPDRRSEGGSGWRTR